MKFEHTFVYELNGEYRNAKLENHDCEEARKAMLDHMATNLGKGFKNYWVRPAHKCP